MTTSERAFLKLAGALGVLSAITTFLLWLLPRLLTPPSTFEESVAQHANPVYLARLWVNFAHVAIALVAYTAAAALLRREAPALTASGLLWFALWAVVELVGVSILIFAVNGVWRAGMAAADEVVREAYRAALAAYPAVWDAMFFVILVAFLLGTLSLGAALSAGTGLRRLVGILHLLAAPLTILIMLDGYFGHAWASAVTGAVYPILQPIARTLLGVWIWRAAGRVEGALEPA